MENQAKQATPLKTKILIGLGLVVIIGLIGAVVYLLMQPKEVVKETITAERKVVGKGTVVTPDNVEELRKGETVEDGYYNADMNVDWTFETATTPSEDAYVRNGVLNTRTVYMDVILPDTNEVVYSSPYIPVGAELTGFALDKEIPAGDYDAVAKYHLVDENNNELSDVSLTVKLHILH
ncbi:MAG: hypothetical protein IJ583_14860 [Firmicutes bacterium]|nr:hypothetical protein [Bacillota bacterium]